jgi:DNA helicase-2/ATP-dependent DNA helicase PcrA
VTIEFTPEQKAVINTQEGNIVAMASPGSGKTSVVVARVKALLAKGVRPDSLLCLTFTQAASKELNLRAGKRDDPAKIFCTFHSWALRFVTREASSFSALGFNLRHNPLATPYEAMKLLGRAVSHQPQLRGKKEAYRDAQNFISLCKRRGISPAKSLLIAESETERAYCTVYEKYQTALRNLGALDFDSIIAESANLLRIRPEVAERHKYLYVTVDEAQDTDSVQWDILTRINKGNVCAVGDTNQALYGWRGGEGNLIEAFCSRFPNAKVLPLSINFRSTPQIVSYCKEIAPVQNETVKNFSTPNAAGIEPEFHRYKDEFEEATAIINSITDLENSAILTRTNRQLRAFEDGCGTRGLKYKLLGKSGFWGQAEVKDVLAFVQHMVGPSDYSTKRIIKSPYDVTRYLRKQELLDHLESIQQGSVGEVPLHTLLSQYNGGDSGQNEIVHNLNTQLSILRTETKNLPAGAAVQRIIDRIGILNYYDDDEDSTGFDNDPRENIREVIKVASSKGSLLDFLRYTQKVHRASLARKGFLTLSTIHGAKGKEWNSVFVAGVNQDVLPHIKGDPEEERKIYFVACSRAAQRLFVSGSGVVSSLISDRVLPEISPNAIETDLYHAFALMPEVAK